jgi:uncharacterized repeat protein (TIGR04042 family)
MHFRVRWPDGRVEQCYSPSTIITRHFEPGASYPLDDFLARARTALQAANERVRSRFGMGCAQAVNQLLAIEASAAAFADTPDAIVRVEGFDQ